MESPEHEKLEERHQELLPLLKVLKMAEQHQAAKVPEKLQPALDHCIDKRWVQVTSRGAARLGSNRRSLIAPALVLTDPLGIAAFRDLAAECKAIEDKLKT
jgi:hypothetical protein